MRAQYIGRFSVGLAGPLILAAGLLDGLYIKLAVAGHLLGLSAHAYELLLLLVVLTARRSKLAWALLMGQNTLSLLLGATALLSDGIPGFFWLQLGAVLTVAVPLALLLSRTVRDHVR